MVGWLCMGTAGHTYTQKAPSQHTQRNEQNFYSYNGRIKISCVHYNNKYVSDIWIVQKENGWPNINRILCFI